MKTWHMMQTKLQHDGHKDMLCLHFFRLFWFVYYCFKISIQNLYLFTLSELYQCIIFTSCPWAGHTWLLFSMICVSVYPSPIGEFPQAFKKKEKEEEKMIHFYWTWCIWPIDKINLCFLVTNIKLYLNCLTLLAVIILASSISGTFS